MPKKHSIPFKAPEISSTEYRKMDHQRRWEYFQQLSQRNRRWVNAHLPEKANYLAVTRNGGILQEGYWVLGTTADKAERRKLDRDGVEYFILQPTEKEHADTVFFFEEKALSIIQDEFRSVDDTNYKKHEGDNIWTFFGDSGRINNLLKRRNVAVGRLFKTCPKVNGEYRGPGATEVKITHQKEGVRHDMYLHSASPDHLRLLGLSTTADDPNTQYRHFQLLHRYDDPVLNIFDSWDIYEEAMTREVASSGKEFKKWNPLVLYQHRLEV